MAWLSVASRSPSRSGLILRLRPPRIRMSHPRKTQLNLQNPKLSAISGSPLPQEKDPPTDDPCKLRRSEVFVLRNDEAICTRSNKHFPSEIQPLIAGRKRQALKA